MYDLLNAETKLKKLFRNSRSCFMASMKLRPYPFDYARWGVLENKNSTSHPNISSLKIAIEEEGNEMSEKFILKSCKSFQRRVDTIFIKKWRPYWVLFFVYFLILLFIFKN